MSEDPASFGEYTEEQRLRLRLHHAEMQRDAFAAALRKEVKEAVLEIIREEIRSALGGNRAPQQRHRID